MEVGRKVRNLFFPTQVPGCSRVLQHFRAVVSIGCNALEKKQFLQHYATVCDNLQPSINDIAINRFVETLRFES